MKIHLQRGIEEYEGCRQSRRFGQEHGLAATLSYASLGASWQAMPRDGTSCRFCVVGHQYYVSTFLRTLLWWLAVKLRFMFHVGRRLSHGGALGQMDYKVSVSVRAPSLQPAARTDSDSPSASLSVTLAH